MSDPAGFARAFAQGFMARDAGAMARLFAEDADFLPLTGGWIEGRPAIERTLDAELRGAFARARLVTGRTKLRSLGATAVVHQRFVLSGVLNADGSEAARIGAILTATLVPAGAGWLAVSAQFAAEG